jgi:hypothetical protein
MTRTSRLAIAAALSVGAIVAWGPGGATLVRQPAAPAAPFWQLQGAGMPSVREPAEIERLRAAAREAETPGTVRLAAR